MSTTPITTASYVHWLLKANAKNLTIDNCDSYTYGILEEFYELEETQFTSVLELGDVVAYYCLLCRCLGQSEEAIATSLDGISFNAQLSTAFLKELTGTSKRIHRGDLSVKSAASVIVENAYKLVCYCCLRLGVGQIEPVLEQNRQKLEARLANTGTFAGQGDR